jgi:hypothetical protein
MKLENIAKNIEKYKEPKYVQYMINSYLKIVNATIALNPEEYSKVKFPVLSNEQNNVKNS